MSRYLMNKFMRSVILDQAELDAYVADPAAYADAHYEGDDDTERRAFRNRDYGTLYALGAHPYLLWSFAEAIWVPDVSRPELVESYRVAARESGYPDWATTPLPA